METERGEVMTQIQELSEEHQKISCTFLFSFTHFAWGLADLQADYVAKKDLVQLIDETETSFKKINESIKTLIHVVSKQEKHLKKWTSNQN